MAWAALAQHHPSCLSTSRQHNRLVTPGTAPINAASLQQRMIASLPRRCWRVRSNARSRQPAGPASPNQFLQAVELAALSAAAACQAVLLVNAAVQYSTTHLSAEQHVAGPQHAAAADPHNHQQQDHGHQQQRIILQPQAPGFGQLAAAHGGQLQSLALLVALMCGVALRYLQKPRLSANPSADAAARLVALEVAAQQQAVQLTTAARQLDKLQARVRVATSDLKVPLRAAQGSASQAAAALVRLAEQQAALQQQLDGSQELIAALQGVAAKQFRVSAEALQQLKAGQSQLSSSTGKALADLKQQQQELQQQMEQQRRQVQTLEVQSMHLQQQQFAAIGGSGGSTGTVSNSGSCSGSSSTEAPPDPWSTSALTSHLAANGVGHGGSAKH